MSVPIDVVMKLLMPLFKKAHNVTSDNYFTYLDLYLRLAKQGCSLVRTIRLNQREIPNNLYETCSLHYTTIVKLADAAVAIVTKTKYQCKKSKSVNILIHCIQMSPFRRRLTQKRNPKHYFFTTKLRWESMFLTKCQDTIL